ncbi:MAG TPA: IS110 family transposase [Candidatus Aminicenantes bacterium]|nr:IS110 family transposase [Candidatus Aminicenantes bacterium]
MARATRNNPVGFQPYTGLKYTDDKHDAFFLARMLKLGILPEGYIMSNEDRPLRDLLRKRLKLVHQRTSHILSFQSLVSRNLGLSVPDDEIKKLAEEEISDLFENEHLGLSARVNIAVINQLKWLIYEIRTSLLKAAKLKPQFEKLLTVPGIGDVLALTIALETGDIYRFAGVGEYASYCRCVPACRISNAKTKGRGNRKNGNKYLAWAFIEAAHSAQRYCPPAKAFFVRKSPKTNKIVAAKALAHKLAWACFYIMRDQVDFDSDRIFGKPIKVDKGCVRKPERGLDSEPLTTALSQQMDMSRHRAISGATHVCQGPTDSMPDPGLIPNSSSLFCVEFSSDRRHKAKICAGIRRPIEAESDEVAAEDNGVLLPGIEL